MSGRCARNPYRQGSVLPAVRNRRHCPVRSSQSVRKLREGLTGMSTESVTYSASVLGVNACGMHLRLAAPPPTGRDEDGPQSGARDVPHDEADRAEATQ